MDLKFRTLQPDEIEVRVGNLIKDKETKLVKGFTLLLYKTARVDAIILDETVGPFNWQKKYYQVKNTMVCSIGIYDETKKEWIWKDDGGDDDSQMEKVKSELSDSQKRSAFVWGIGRELYFGPKITIWSNSGNSEFDYYSVSQVKFDDKKNMTELTIYNETKGVVAFVFKNGKVLSTNNVEPPTRLNANKGTINANQKALINAKILKLNQEQSDRFFEWLDKKCGTMNIDLLSEEQGDKVCKSWKLI